MQYITNFGLRQQNKMGIYCGRCLEVARKRGALEQNRTDKLPEREDRTGRIQCQQDDKYPVVHPGRE